MIAAACALALLSAGPLTPAAAEQVVELCEPQKEKLGWTFENGPEFPGATGSLSVVPGEEGAPAALKLVGDFRKGGGYVQAGRPLADLEVVSVSAEVNDPDQDLFKFRITDSTGQCHQVRYRVGRTKGYQRVTFPLRRFFERMGRADAVTNVTRYEHWGGENDGKWHGPATELEILISATEDQKLRTVGLRRVRVTTAPRVEPATVTKWVALDAEGPKGWKLGLGWEFKGAKATLEAVKDVPAEGESCLKLAADFTEGGKYVEAWRPLGDLGLSDITTFRFRVRAEGGAERFRLRLVDGTGQVHQGPNIFFKRQDEWRDMVLKIPDIVGRESWAGANDRKWHGPPKMVTFLLAVDAQEKNKRPVLYLADVEVEAILPARPQAAKFEERFEASDRLPAGWTARGNVAVVAEEPFEGKRSLRLSRTQEKANEPAEAAGPTFAVRPGEWLITGAARCDLHSPDNSYNAAVTLECLAASGRPVERLRVAEIYGKSKWQPVRKQVTVPRQAVSARLRVRLNKTWGRFWLDDLAAAHLVAAPKKDDRIIRALLTTERVGNLLFPGDAPVINMVLEARRELQEQQHRVQYVLRDYWGAEQAKPATATLAPVGKPKPGMLRYDTKLDLTGAPIDVGRYYEVHLRIAGKDIEPFDEYTSFAVLPEAVTKKHRWQDIPFTSRNWDNRIPAYFELSDRIGVRVCGLWSGWKPAPPYKVSAPRWEYIEKFDMGAVMRTQGHTIERHRKGWEKYTEKVLREGTATMVREYNTGRRIAAVCLGNEPHGKGEKILEDVRAYKAMYEGAKQADPDVLVLGTSVGPEEAYFKAGMGKYCDVYDFHTYGTAAGIRRLIGRYRKLFEKYGHEKPLWSTELGRNSEGMTRHDVAAGLIRSFSTFFACGGANCSWFGILYPDPQGKMAGSAGQSHNVFFCRYRCYSPKLDAIAYYNMVNGICVKKFVAERMYDGIRAILFRDKQGRCLQVLWHEQDARDVLVPLDGVGEVKLLRIDGSSALLDAGDGGLTLRVARDPVLLFYTDADGKLPEKLGEPLATLGPLPATIRKGATATIAVRPAGGDAPDVALQVPPFWRAARAKAPAGGQVGFEVTAPAESAVQAAPIRVVLKRGARQVGELDFRVPVSDRR
jgi:hypothetical protein